MKLNITGVLFAAGLSLALASPAVAADHIFDKSQLSLSRNNGPGDAGFWEMPALVIAAFAAGYGVRSLVSSRRHRRARRSKFGDVTPSHRLQAGSEADNPQLSLRLVPRDDVGDLQSPAASHRGAT